MFSIQGKLSYVHEVLEIVSDSCSDQVGEDYLGPGLNLLIQVKKLEYCLKGLALALCIYDNDSEEVCRKVYSIFTCTD